MSLNHWLAQKWSWKMTFLHSSLKHFRCLHFQTPHFGRLNFNFPCKKNTSQFFKFCLAKKKFNLTVNFGFSWPIFPDSRTYKHPYTFGPIISFHARRWKCQGSRKLNECFLLSVVGKENCGKFWVVTTEGKLFAKLPVCGYRRVFSWINN